MIILLGGAMHIKNERHRYWDWCVSEYEKRDIKIKVISMGFFVSGDQTQKFF